MANSRKKPVEEIQEIEVVEEKETYSHNDNDNKKSSGTGIYKGIIVFLLILILAMLLYLAFGKKLFDKDNTNSDKTKIELNYTETNDKIKEGVYITDVSEVVENVMPSIVAITSKTLVSSGQYGPSFWGQNRYSEGSGSGIIISKSDDKLMILTNNHVVEGAKELSVKFINDKSYDAEVLGISERRDIAIITVKLEALDKDTLENIRLATIGDSGALKVGNGVIAIGNALGYGQSVTTGVVSALNREVQIDSYTNKMIQIDAAINGGNSGGALLNARGEVVGINSAKYSSSALSSSASIEGMGFAIPISDVKELITSLINGEEDKVDASIGIEGYIITSEQSSAYNMPVGFYISKIVSGGGADKAKLEIGNIVTKIEGNSVKSITDIQDVLYKKKKGDKVKLTISYISGKSYKEKVVTVTLS